MSGYSNAGLRVQIWKLFSAFFLVMAIWGLPGCATKDDIPADPHDAISFGWKQLASAEYETAERAFLRASDRAAAGSRDFLMARFGLANTYQNLKPAPNYEFAQKVYTEIVNADKGGELGAWSALALIRIQHLKLYEVGRTGAAAMSGLPTTAELNKIRAGYAGVIAQFPAAEAASEAAMFIGAAHIEEVSAESIAKGIDYLNGWIKAHPNDRYLTHAYELIASAYEMMARDKPELWPLMMDAAIQSLKLNEDPDADVSGALYRIAHVAEVYVNKPEIAIEYYWKLKKKYPTDSRIFYCNRALKRLGEKVDDEPLDSGTYENGGAK